MKKMISFFVAVMLASGLYACTGTTTSQSDPAANLAPGNKVEVLYFHFTRRCMTCNNVEKVSKDAVENQFADKVKSGEVTFRSINLEEKEGETAGAKYKIDGQSLVVVCGDKKVDLTEQGFMYANNKPEKLKAEIKKAVEGMLK